MAKAYRDQYGVIHVVNDEADTLIQSHIAQNGKLVNVQVPHRKSYPILTRGPKRSDYVFLVVKNDRVLIEEKDGFRHEIKGSDRLLAEPILNVLIGALGETKSA